MSVQLESSPVKTDKLNVINALLGSIQISETSSSRPSTLQAIGVFFWFIVVAMCADNLLISWKNQRHQILEQ
jgi:hypothetical protein